MLDPMTTLFIGIICGFGVGYPVGFLIARLIYRSKFWPHPDAAGQ